MRGASELPVDALELAKFVTHCLTAGSLLVAKPKPLAPSTVERRIATISSLSVERRSERITARRAAPLSVPAIKSLVAHVTGGLLNPTDLRTNRDRALLLLGFATAARRSELVLICVEVLVAAPEGLLVTIHHQKTSDQASVAPIPWAASPEMCPVRAAISLRTMLAGRGITRGPIFTRVSRSDNVIGSGLSPKSVADIVAKHTRAVGMHVPDGFGQWSAHSLRRGFATSARYAGADAMSIAR